MKMSRRTLLSSSAAAMATAALPGCSQPQDNAQSQASAPAKPATDTGDTISTLLEDITDQMLNASSCKKSIQPRFHPKMPCMST